MPNEYQEAGKSKSNAGKKSSVVKKVFLTIGIVLYVLILAIYVYINAVRLLAANNGQDPVYFGNTKLFTTYNAELDPDVKRGSLLLVTERISYERGMIIAISNPGIVEADVYRVEQPQGDNTGEMIYDVKKYFADTSANPVAHSDISGEVTNSIEILGHVFTFINGIGGLILIIILPLVLLAVWIILKFVRRSDNDELYDEDEIMMSETGSLLYDGTEANPEVGDIDFNSLKQNYQDSQQAQVIPEYEDVLKRMGEKNAPTDIQDVKDVSDLRDAAFVDESKEYRSGVLDEFDENTVLYSGTLDDEYEEEEEFDPESMNEYDTFEEFNAANPINDLNNPSDADEEIEQANQEEEQQNEETSTHNIDAYMTDEGLEINVSNLRSDNIRFVIASDGRGIIISSDNFQAEVNVDIRSI